MKRLNMRIYFKIPHSININKIKNRYENSYNLSKVLVKLINLKI